MSGERKPKDPGKRTSTVDHDLIRELARLLEETGLTEIEFERNGQRVRVVRQGQIGAAPGHAVPAPAIATELRGGDAGPIDPAKHAGVVTSPMVGTAYLSPEPGKPAFVSVGSKVSEGQTILIIEAMKTMNPVPSPVAGRIAEIYVYDSQRVEFGEPLMLIE